MNKILIVSYDEIGKQHCNDYYIGVSKTNAIEQFENDARNFGKIILNIIEL